MMFLDVSAAKKNGFRPKFGTPKLLEVFFLVEITRGIWIAIS